ncbi:MAG TPA: heme o synthase, partial [bacterium]|nr:heme o synthase [bacterium]
MRRYRVLAVATAAAAYALIVLGGLVRITGAGLACPDWPLCHGRLIPPLEGRVVIEYAHRLAAALVSALVIVTALEAFRIRRRVAPAGPLAILVMALVAIQVIVGGLTVKLQLTPALVTIHLGIAMLFLAALLVQAVVALGEPDAPLPVASGFRGLAVAAAGATYVMILIGGYVGSSAAALACPDLPFCRGTALVASGWPAYLHMLHRAWALVVITLVLATANAAPRTAIRAITAAANLALLLVFVQVVAGMVNVATRLAPVAQGAHLALAAALFGTLVVLGSLPILAGEPTPLPGGPGRGDRRALPTIAGGSVEDPAEALPWTPPAGRSSAIRSAVATAADYLALMKPRIILLLLITTCTTMIVASPHHVAVRILLLTLLGGTLAAGSANAFNMYIDRDIDAVMQRTCLRPVPAGRLRPAQALGFGVATGLLSIVVMAWGVNALSAVLSTAGILFYVGVYTLWLKRTTPQNIVIGGAAGAVPPLVGWAAATGHVALPAVALFAIVFLWTPPHFWALALGKADDYRAARVPMLPVVRGDQETRRQIFIYALALTAATLLLYAPLHALGIVYLAAAVLLDGLFVFLAWAVLVKRSPRAEMALFGYSILYLALLFGAMVVDR